MGNNFAVVGCAGLLFGLLIGSPLVIPLINPPHERPIVDFTKTPDLGLPTTVVDMDEDGVDCGSLAQMQAVGGNEAKVDLTQVHKKFAGLVCWEIPTAPHAVASDSTTVVQ